MAHSMEKMGPASWVVVLLLVALVVGAGIQGYSINQHKNEPDPNETYYDRCIEKTTRYLEDPITPAMMEQCRQNTILFHDLKILTP